MAEEKRHDRDILPCAYPEWQAKRPETSFWAEFSVLERFGEHSLKNAFERCFAECKEDYRKLTELTAVLNHKMWDRYESGDEKTSRVYNELWGRADRWGKNRLKGDALEHFCMVLD